VQDLSPLDPYSHIVNRHSGKVPHRLPRQPRQQRRGRAVHVWLYGALQRTMALTPGLQRRPVDLLQAEVLPSRPDRWSAGASPLECCRRSRARGM